MIRIVLWTKNRYRYRYIHDMYIQNNLEHHIYRYIHAHYYIVSISLFEVFIYIFKFYC